MSTSRNKNQKNKYLKYLLVALMIVGMLGMYIIPSQYAFADEEYPEEQEQAGEGDVFLPGDGENDDDET